MPAAAHCHGVRGAALLPVVLVAFALWITACGSDDRSGPRRTATPGGSQKTPAPTASPTPTATASRSGPPRTVDAVLDALAGRRIRADGKIVSVDPGTLTCGGSGPPVRRRGGEPEWTRFSCIQPTFPRGSVAGPDLLFVVESADPQRLVVTQRYFTGY